MTVVAGWKDDLRMTVESTILFFADPDAPQSAAADALVAGSDYRVITATRENEAADVVRDAHVDLVIADIDCRGADVVGFLSRLRFTHPTLVRILLVGERCAMPLCDALARTAAYQYLTKPLQPDQVCLVVKRALETRELARRHRLLARELKIGEDFKPVPRQARASRARRSLVLRTPRLCERSDVGAVQSRARGGAHGSADPDRGRDRHRQGIAGARAPFPFAPLARVR